ncbi:MAG TPA: histidinol dehydrogenase [Steroidobacteraceae bacterium]|nr:histidinol dehydrogenase [Steroidobacteraceae bacterium]
MERLDWQDLDDAGRCAALARPPEDSDPRFLGRVREIIATVRREGDGALRGYASEFDHAELGSLQVSEAEFAAAEAQLAPEALRALQTAINNVTTFHLAQMPRDVSLETQPGVRCERLVRPIQAVGLYVPAGSAPLPSTAIMLAVPSRLARCPQRVLCTPPRRDGTADPAVLVVARRCDIDSVFKVGGAQAIAAMAYGTASIPKVAKVYGPGNRWVNAAKQLISTDPQGAAIDMPAGPSEVMVIADETASATFVALDLLAQAEHDPHAQALLLTTSAELADRVAARVAQLVPGQPRRAVLEKSLAAARLIVVPDLATAVAIAETYAPEHLLVQTRAPRALLGSISTAGAVFLGAWSPEPLGDYCSGTNHVLPTNGYARAYSGLGVGDFMRSMVVQELSAAGLEQLGPAAATLARLEGLEAHAAAVEARLERLRAREARHAGLYS